MRKQSQIEYWVPGGSIAYLGTPKTRLEWIRLTWRGYLGYWELLFWVVWLLVKGKLEAKSD